LDFDALARGGDVGDRALHLREVVELLFVREIERLAGVLSLVQRRVRLGLKMVLTRFMIPMGPP